MVETLKVMAESEGERGHQTMVKKMDRRTLALGSQEVDRRHKRVSQPAGGSPATIPRLKLTRNCAEPFGKALSSITRSLVGEGGVYGGGLHKAVPKNWQT
jgi:hypothetical protein